MWTDKELHDFLLIFKSVVVLNDNAYEMAERYNVAFDSAKELLANVEGMDVDRATHLLLAHMANRHRPGLDRRRIAPLSSMRIAF